jgi:hypothetical protein
MISNMSASTNRKQVKGKPESGKIILKGEAS